ncbi:hypothetical protein ACUXPF_000465 [Sphingomonas sanguinis]
MPALPGFEGNAVREEAGFAGGDDLQRHGSGSEA